MNEISLPDAFNIVSSATEPDFRHTNESSFMVYQALNKLKEALQDYDRISTSNQLKDSAVE